MSGTILSIAAEAENTALPVCKDELLPKTSSGPSFDELSDHSFPGKGGQDSQPFSANDGRPGPGTPRRNRR
jgi:hypothetical protein